MGEEELFDKDVTICAYGIEDFEMSKPHSGVRKGEEIKFDSCENIH